MDIHSGKENSPAVEKSYDPQPVWKSMKRKGGEGAMRPFKRAPRVRRGVPFGMMNVSLPMMGVLWLLTAMLALRGAVEGFRLAQRLLWLTAEFRPLRLPYEREFMLCHEGLMLCGAVLSVLTAFAVALFALRRSIRTLRFLRRLMSFRRVCAHLAGWLCLAGAGALCWLCSYYRLSVQLVGMVGLMGLALFVLFMFEARFFYRLRMILLDVGVGMRTGGMVGRGRWRMFPLQALVTALFRLVPVVLTACMGLLINAVGSSLPFITP